MIYKLKDGDILKVLPILQKNDTFVPILEKKMFNISKRLIFDDDKNGYLGKSIQNLIYHGTNKNNHTLGKTYFICVYINNEIKYVRIGKTICEKMQYYKFDPRNNLHLSINIDMKDIGNGTKLPSYKSTIVEKDWDRPSIDINSQSDWINFIKNNQQGYIEDYLEKYNVYNNMDILKESGLTDAISELVIENRERKLNKILN
jgi:hypothetical protein